VGNGHLDSRAVTSGSICPVLLRTTLRNSFVICHRFLPLSHRRVVSLCYSLAPAKFVVAPAWRLTIMDFAVPSLVGTSDASSCNESSGLLTPESSPLFRPSHPKESFESRLAHAFEEPKRRKLEPPSPPAESLFVPSFADLFAPVPSDVRKICVIGAGYVGKYFAMFEPRESIIMSLQAGRPQRSLHCTIQRSESRSLIATSGASNAGTLRIFRSTNPV
jgi:hypothetical protein